MIGQPLFVAGAAKAGTNTVFDLLAGSFNRARPTIKEPGFFSPDIGGSNLVTNWSDYLRLYGNDPSTLIDGSVSYLLSEQAPQAILDRFPRAQFIVCLRRQSEMALSFHGQLRRNLTENQASFADAWQAQERRAQGHDVPDALAEPRLLQYRWVCSIGLHVERLLKTVPREQILFIEHQKLRDEPGTVRQALGSFLAIDANELPEIARINPAQEWTIDLAATVGKLPAWSLGPLSATKRALHRRGFPLTRILSFLLQPANGDRSAADDELLRLIQYEYEADTERLRVATGLRLEQW